MLIEAVLASDECYAELGWSGVTVPRAGTCVSL